MYGGLRGAVALLEDEHSKEECAGQSRRRPDIVKPVTSDRRRAEIGL
jgi:hypothetical protein